MPADAVLNLPALSPTYGADNVQRLINLYSALANQADPITGNPLTATQIQLLLSQALWETGLFTDNPNLKNIDQDHNYAGINSHGNFSGDSSNYAIYPDIPAFVTDWLNVLSHGTQPIEANTPSDFVTRLKSNGYFTDAYNTYYTGVNAYYNLLSSVELT